MTGLRSYIVGICSLTLLASCNAGDIEESTGTSTPITFSVYSTSLTKGYIQGTTMMETGEGALHSSGTATARPFVLAGYNHADLNEGEFFRDEVFEKDGDVWRHDPAILWPLGAEMDFLAYSSGDGFASDEVTWDYGKATEGVTLTVSRAHTQDDILFSCALDRTVEENRPVPMVFGHAQAWIQVALTIKEGCSLEGKVRLDSLAFDDIYTDGILSVTHPYGYAEGRWSFRLSRAEDTTVDDVNGLYGSTLSTSPLYLDMLLPEQTEKSMVIYYTYLTTPDVHLVEELELPHATWQMGKKYVYEIVVASHEITVSPSVADWDAMYEPVDI